MIQESLDRIGRAALFGAGNSENACDRVEAPYPCALLFSIPTRAYLDLLNRLLEVAFSRKMKRKLLVTNCFCCLLAKGSVASQFANFLQKALFHHQAHAAVDSPIEFGRFPVEADDHRIRPWLHDRF